MTTSAGIVPYAMPSRKGILASPQGRSPGILTTLAALISGIVGSKSTQLPHIATKVPDGTKPESRVKRFARWCDNAHILEEVYFLPYADVLLRHLALQTVVLVMDGSGVGRGCTALMIHVVYKGRALPLAWRVRQAPKGHFPEDLHIAVVELMREVIPEGAKVVFLGDGEFDGTALQATLHEAGWSYVCRTAMSTMATWDGRRFASIPWGRVSSQAASSRSRRSMSPERHMVPSWCCVVGPRGIKSRCIWSAIWLTAEEACRLYEKRFRIETFFSDQKSRGFHIHKSHMSDVQRLSRLLIAACLAYIWIIYLGSVCEKERMEPSFIVRNAVI